MKMRNELQTVLHKIETIMAGEEAMSRLEKDLIKSYLLKAVSLLEDSTSKPAESDEIETPEIRVEQEKEAMKAALASEIVEPPPEVAVTKPPVSEPVEILATHRNGESATMPQDNTLVEMIQASPLDQRYAALFADEDSSELSDQLANSPISDLNKSIGINDRILYINELFAGDGDEYADTMDTLNRKPNFEEAQVFLSRHLIDKFEWMDEGKIERARDFIKLIARRFKS